jgi:virulence factor Mce-like protein
VKFSHVVSFAVFGLIVAVGIYYIGALGVRAGPPDDRINLAMQVDDVNGLVVDSNVLLRGVAVGKVTGIETSRQSATLHFYVDHKYQVPVDTEVRLENLSALGESYIGFVPRTDSGPMFHDGQTIATENVREPASISELSTGVVRVLNQMDPQQLTSVIAEVDSALPDQRIVLPNLVRASTLLRNMVKGLNGRGSELLTNLQTILKDAGYVGPALADISPDLYATGQPLKKLFYNALDVVVKTGNPQALVNFKHLIDRIQGLLDQRGPDLKVFAEAFMPNIQKTAAALLNIDSGQVLTNILDAVPEDGTITLRVRPPDPQGG